jgi:NADPH2:quinone reductase
MPSWSNTPSGIMRAAVLSAPGASPPSACFTIDPSYPKPTLPGPDWLLVRVRAAGLNRAELRGRAGERPAPPEFGMFADEYHEDPPRILGEEFVGEVAETGANCDEFKQGDTVAGWVYGGGKAYDGAYAEYTLVHRRGCFKFDWPLGPGESIPWEIVGGVPMSMYTAYGSLFVAGQTAPGATVLVHGSTSSVGVWAILLAKERGCTVIATTRQEHKVERLRSAGADHVILESELRQAVPKIAPSGVDTIIELVGPDQVVNVSLPLLARHGTVVVTGVLSKDWVMKEFTPAMIPSTRKMTMYTLNEEDVPELSRVLREVMTKVKEGTFQAEVFLDKVFPLANVGQAHEYMENNKAVGKVVLRID